MRFVSEAIAHVEQNLGADLSLAALAGRCGLSPWQFHRRFEARVGETPGHYVRRLRLELAGVLLKHSDRPVTEIAFRVGYETHEAFTRAFRSRFGASPVEFRRGQPEAAPSELRIVRWPARRIAFVRHVGPYARAGAAFDTLLAWASARGLRPDAVLGIYRDDQDLTDRARTRCEAALWVGASVESDDTVEIRTLPAADWAVARHAGPFAERRRLYTDAYRAGIPALGRRAADRSPLERYAVTQRGVEYGAADIHIPLEPR